MSSCKKKVGKDPDGNVWQIAEKLSVQISDSLQGFFRAGGAGAIATRMASGAKACHSFQGDATRNRGLFFTRFALAIGFFFPILAEKVGTSFASTRCHVWGAIAHVFAWCSVWVWLAGWGGGERRRLWRTLNPE